jgi:hypothetical protein
MILIDEHGDRMTLEQDTDLEVLYVKTCNIGVNLTRKMTADLIAFLLTHLSELK